MGFYTFVGIAVFFASFGDHKLQDMRVRIGLSMIWPVYAFILILDKISLLYDWRK